MSTILVDTLTGKTTAGNVTVTSGTTTMKLQEGICTGWTNYDAYNGSTHGSFNQSSLTDNGTGDFTLTFSNNSASATDRLVMSLPWNNRGSAEAADPTRAGDHTSQSHLNNATSTIRMRYYYGSDANSHGAAHDLEGHYFGKISELA